MMGRRGKKEKSLRRLVELMSNLTPPSVRYVRWVRGLHQVKGEVNGHHPRD